MEKKQKHELTGEGPGIFSLPFHVAIVRAPPHVRLRTPDVSLGVRNKSRNRIVGIRTRMTAPDDARCARNARVVLARNRSTHNSVVRSDTRPTLLELLHLDFSSLFEAVSSRPRRRGLETQRSTGGSPGHITPSQEPARWQRRKRPRRRPRRRRSSFLVSMRGSQQAGSPLCFVGQRLRGEKEERRKAKRQREGRRAGRKVKARRGRTLPFALRTSPCSSPHRVVPSPFAGPTPLPSSPYRPAPPPVPGPTHRR